ncbi:uromodulin-like isoform X2 [Brachionus plicatilis]|uniref:Uromodulin-like isoform X2 n=1 Tax=Brachionus plicatilis TaxID=10195 RepID=A0A3M7T546_BRAPC|nr:uromodulin-like isoform X2 [Brachionus plicatilis]
MSKEKKITSSAHTRQLITNLIQTISLSPLYINSFSNTKSNNLPNYICTCSHFERSDTFDCLKVYVGMAIKGHNLLYNRWIDKENCINICLNTTVLNGHKFDCKSFEHWHGNCNQNADSSSSSTQICASFDESHKKTRRTYQKYQSRPKLDYCVLSNQTINSAENDFNSNNAVTYYELTCQTDKDKNTQQKTFSKVYSLKTTKLYDFGNYRSNECSFNPCLNGGSCILGKNDRFMCLCDKFHHGINCELDSLGKKCFNNYMEIYVQLNLADRLNIKLMDLYVNDPNDPYYCRLRKFNETFAKFRIPYEKCSTKTNTTSHHTVYINKLYSSTDIELNSEQKKLLSIFECEIEVVLSKSNKSLQPNQIIKTHSRELSENTCFMDFLNLKLEIFSDHEYQDRVIKDSEIVHGQPIYVEFSVHHSEKMSQIQEKLKYFHLTIPECWLSESKNGQDIIQILIKDGCSKDQVVFNKIPNKRNSIRFSFLFKSFDEQSKTTSIYLHCLPEICSDASRVLRDYSNFYSQFRSCKDLDNDCAPKRSKRNFTTKYSLINVLKTNKNEIKEKKSNCSLKYSIGPIRIISQKMNLLSHANKKIQGSENKNKFSNDALTKFKIKRLFYEKKALFHTFKCFYNCHL